MNTIERYKNIQLSMNIKHRGFTLLEILLVVAAIGILAAIVIVAIDPNRQLGKVRDAERQNEVATLKNALEQYTIEAGSYPSEIPVQSYKTVCNSSSSEIDSTDCSNNGYVNLSDDLDDQLAKIPRDPQKDESDASTGYEVSRDGNGNITVRAPQAEQESVIKVGPGILGKMYYGHLGDSDLEDTIKAQDGTSTIAVGSTSEYGGSDKDLFLTKYNKDGTVSWMKTIGESGSGEDVLVSVEKTNDGGYILAGYTESYGDSASQDGIVVKLDSNNTVAWTKVIGSKDNRDEFESVIELSSGSFMAAGFSFGLGGSDRDGMLTKLDSNGNISWTKTLGGGSDDEFQSLVEQSDGIIIGGWMQSYYDSGTVAGWVVKIDTSGTKKWFKYVKGNEYTPFESIAQADNGDLVLVGYRGKPKWIGGSATGQEAYVVRLNSDGTKQRAYTVGGSADDIFNDVSVIDNQLIAIGSTDTFGGSQEKEDGFITKFDDQGGVVWSKVIDSSDDSVDNAFNSMHAGLEDVFVGVGYSQDFGSDNKGVALKLGTSGNGLDDCSKCSSLSLSATSRSDSIVTHTSDDSFTDQTSTANVDSPSLSVTDQSGSSTLVCKNY